jgi:hypothetical protein
MGRAARAHVETQHSITAEAEALIEVYRRLLTPDLLCSSNTP